MTNQPDINIKTRPDPRGDATRPRKLNSLQNLSEKTAVVITLVGWLAIVVFVLTMFAASLALFNGLATEAAQTQLWVSFLALFAGCGLSLILLRVFLGVAAAVIQIERNTRE